MRGFDNDVFSFSIGGFFQGHSSFEISKDGEACSFRHSQSHLLEQGENQGILDKTQVDALMAFLCDLGTDDWFTYYDSPVLDGEQWSLFDGHGSHGGSNAYPKGFEKLLKYLADEFGCEEMRPKTGETYDGPTETEGLAMLAFYNLPSAEGVGQGLEDGKADGDHKKWPQAIRDAKRDFLHDVYAFAEAYPEYKCYGDILAQHGLELDIEQIVNQDVSKADAKLVVASMIAIARSDRWCECDDFGRCVENGTFALWTKRLRELL